MSRLVFALAALLALAVPASAAVVYISGLETDNASEVVTLGASNTIASSGTNAPLHGAWSLVNASTSVATTLKTGLAATQVGFRTSLNIFTSAVAGTIASAASSTPTTQLDLQVVFTKLATVSTACGALSGTTTGTTVLAGNTLYTVRWVIDGAAGGVIQAWLDDSLEVNATHASACATIDRITVGPTSNATNQYVFDDLLIQTGALTLPPKGIVIARQGTAGTPTDNAWGTKTCSACASTSCAGSCTTATSCCAWSETPFGTAKLASTTTANAQGVLVAPFNATVASFFGTQTIGSSDVVNACKVAIVAKVSATSTTGASIRHRLNGSNTDTVLSGLSTTDKYFDDCCWAPTATSHLNTAEMGLTVTSGTRTWTVEDVWMNCDYAPVKPLPRSMFQM